MNKNAYNKAATDKLAQWLVHWWQYHFQNHLHGWPKPDYAHALQLLAQGADPEIRPNDPDEGKKRAFPQISECALIDCDKETLHTAFRAGADVDNQKLAFLRDTLLTKALGWLQHNDSYMVCIPTLLMAYREQYDHDPASALLKLTMQKNHKSAPNNSLLETFLNCAFHTEPTESHPCIIAGIEMISSQKVSWAMDKESTHCMLKLTSSR